MASNFFVKNFVVVFFTSGTLYCNFLVQTFSNWNLTITKFYGKNSIAVLVCEHYVHKLLSFFLSLLLIINTLHIIFYMIPFCTFQYLLLLCRKGKVEMENIIRFFLFFFSLITQIRIPVNFMHLEIKIFLTFQKETN